MIREKEEESGFVTPFGNAYNITKTSSLEAVDNGAENYRPEPAAAMTDSGKVQKIIEFQHVSKRKDCCYWRTCSSYSQAGDRMRYDS